jgi:hypothetical protein
MEKFLERVKEDIARKIQEEATVKEGRGSPFRYKVTENGFSCFKRVSETEKERFSHAHEKCCLKDL